MADCTTCGNKAGLGKKLCADCTAKEQQRRDLERRAQEERMRAVETERQQAEEERKRKEQEARQLRLTVFLEQRVAALQALIDQGVTPYLYSSIQIDSQSYFNESPNPKAWNFKTATGPIGASTDVSHLQSLGWRGWEVVGVVPVTFGSTLYNTIGGSTVYAASYGGLVVGAQLLLRLPITDKYLTDSRASVVEHLTREFPG